MLVKHTHTKIPGTMPTLGDNHFPNLGSNFVSNSSKHPQVIGTVAADVGSIFPNRCLGALHPTAISIFSTEVGGCAPHP